jgi:hypothetical protein
MSMDARREAKHHEEKGQTESRTRPNLTRISFVKVAVHPWSDDDESGHEPAQRSFDSEECTAHMEPLYTKIPHLTSTEQHISYQFYKSSTMPPDQTSSSSTWPRAPSILDILGEHSTASFSAIEKFWYLPSFKELEFVIFWI